MTSMTSKVLSLRMDSELFDRLHDHAAKRGMSVQDYVVRTLVRDDFDERFKASLERTERFYGSSGRTEAADPAVTDRRGSTDPPGLSARPGPARWGRA
ncbi:hypothetical protein H181DRAFT_05487 [Streptomyces sp. WMMB 714]|nr:hypothetical protein [Streptomyces sp. WMMB 714]SCK57951.1 hypothetical protein H181DRAFT_05487 [Streptomyces sp. WMMB 714]